MQTYSVGGLHLHLAICLETEEWPLDQGGQPAAQVA